MSENPFPLCLLLLVLLIIAPHTLATSSKAINNNTKSYNNNNNIMEQIPLIKQSTNFIPCHFNLLCYCKYDQRTEIYESLKNLWHLSGFNETIFSKSVSALLKDLKSDPNYLMINDYNDISNLAQLVLNSSNYSYLVKFDPGPVFEFACAEVPIAIIPTDYTTHGVISHISVQGSKLNILDGSAFAGLEIQNIQLSRNELFSISEYAFSSMSNSLTVLDLSANLLDEIPFTAFKTLKILEWLNLSNNLLTSISGDWFSVSSSLRQLTLAANSIDFLPYKLFPAFSRLIWLDLSSNFIRNLTQHNLPSNLQTLLLMKNPLSTFPSEIFHLRSLSWLVLSGCAIERVPTDWPRSITGPLQMNQMDLTQNFIQIWPSRPFSSQLTILDLDVSKNYIQKLPPASFHSMNTFRLSLGHNRIHSIDPFAFESLENTLQYLNLDNNRLKHIPWRAAQNLTSLMHLYVGSNLIQDEGVWSSTSEGKTSSKLKCKLTYLGLNGNQLTKFPKKLLTKCPNLLHLNLGYNQIAHLDELAELSLKHKKFPNLSTLILRNNPIYTLAYINNEIVSNNFDEYDEEQDNTLESVEIKPETVTSSTSNIQQQNVFRPEIFPNLYELSLSFCQLSGELEPFPSLQLTNLEISMGLKSATNINSNMFQGLRQLEWIALDHNSISSVSDYCFYSNKNLTYVNLSFNKITSLPRQMFHPDIHSSITQLRLSHNKIQTIHTDSFLSFPAINLDLSYNNIHTIEKHAFTVAPIKNTVINNEKHEGNLLNLYLNHNKITTIKTNAFAQEKFNLVDLSYNGLGHFNFDSFGRKTILRAVNISHNFIERIGNNHRRIFLKFVDASHNKIQYGGVSNAFDNICPTELLSMKYNFIERVDSSIFPANCSLKEINLNNNKIISLDPESFSNVRDLTVLHLAHNQISYVPEILLIRNHKLTYLDLSHNRIRTLPRDSLVGSNIEILMLGGNQFVNLPVGALQQISRRLKYMDMSQNSLEHLDSTMFESIPGLVHLNLSLNRLSVLPDNAFANLGSLRELDLSGNFLRANFKELFHFLPKLKRLRLSNCEIKELPFLPLPHLISLDLSSNGMKEIKMQSLASLSRLRHLDLTNNELSGGKIPSWTHLTNLISLKLSNNPIKSLTKDTFFGLNRLETLEILDLGRLDRFDSDVLSYLINLKSLAVETYPNIEKYRFRLGAVLSGISNLQELKVQIKEATLSDQLFGGILPKMRKLSITGRNLKRIEPLAFEGLQNCLHMDLTITHTSISELPPHIFQLLQNAEVAKLDLRFNKLQQLDSAAVYHNRSVWFSRGTKLIQGGLELEGNPWHCSCNLVWIGEWLRRWLRESFESHSTAIPLVHSMYQNIQIPTCTTSSGESVPLIELYADVLCHASALSNSPTQPQFINYIYLLVTTISAFLLPLFHPVLFNSIN